MPFVPDLSRRNLQPELMDGPDLDPASHRAALAGLARLNLWSRSAGILWPSICAAARSQSHQPLRVLDVASGAGDAAVRLCRKARRCGVALAIVGLDISPVAVEYASRRARAAGVDATFRVHDAVRQPLPEGFDVVMSSLFLHHLNDSDAVTF